MRFYRQSKSAQDTRVEGLAFATRLLTDPAKAGGFSSSAKPVRA
jgi:hypothetical protein